MIYNEIIIEETREELIQYPYKNWNHIILHTTLNKTLYGYIPIHWHNALQYVYVINGKLNVRISEESIIVNRGEGLFINSNIVHEIKEQIEDTEFFCWNIEIEDNYKEIEKNYLNMILNPNNNVPFIHLSPYNYEQKQLIENIKNAGEKFVKKVKHFKLEVTINYYKSLKHLVNIIGATDENSTYYFDDRVKILIEFIKENYSTNISLQILSRRVHLSKAETIRLFKKYVGQTPFEYILNVRLENSVKLLKNNNTDTVTEIAYACGFSTTSYFIRKFKERYSFTPKQFVKNSKPY